MRLSEVMHRTLRWVAIGRYAILSVALLAALFLYRYQDELVPVPQSALISQDVVARYIGPMEAVRRRQDKEFTRRNAGVGLEYTPGDEPEDTPLPTVRRVVFSQQLSLTAEDVKLIRARGPRYTIGVANDEVVTISGAGSAPIAYSEYARRTAGLQRFWLQVAVAATILGCALFSLGQWHGTRESTAA